MHPRSTGQFLLACILFAGCDGAVAENPLVTLQGIVINDEGFLSQPGRLLMIGDRLLVTDNLPPHLHVLDGEGRHVASTGNSGGGPGEFSGVFNIQEDPRRDGSFWLYDVDQGRMTRMGVDPGTAVPRLMEVKRLDFAPGSVYLEPILLDDTTLVTTGIYPEGRLLRARRTGEPLGTIGATPSAPAGRNVPMSVLQHAYAGPLERSPDGSRLAVATRQADLLELYRSDGTLIRKLRGGSGFEPAYEVRRTPGGVSMATGEDLRFGYIDLAATDDYVFALFSGERRGDLPGRANFGKVVQVFSWAGDRVATFELPERAISIAVSPDGARLFAVQHDPKPTVVRYSVREHLPGSE